MTVFYLDGQRIEFKPTETVLDALIRHGQGINYSCKKGVCKTCLLQQVGGRVEVGAQRGLSSSLKQKHYICACQCRASADLQFKSILEQDLFALGNIESKTLLNESMVSILIRLKQPIAYEPGQYFNFRRFDGLTRSYCPVNNSGDPLLEIHVKRKYNGQFSDWLYHRAGVGEPILVQGPLGQSYYQEEYSKEKLIIIAFGSGLGVAYGVASQALARGHQGEVYLYVGVRDENELYQHTKLLKMMLEYRNFTYQACITGQTPPREMGRCVSLGDPFHQATQVHKLDRQAHLFLCGDAKPVNHARELAFLNGYPVEHIHTLSFEYKDLRKRIRQ
ncbi:2Fe-2S iron-sulfur cluster-binding protein [Shewanella sp. AS1]|uniref:2Fe-2S iron-sulfur cluster-binding protein n=1 Tax=Shewanella sp. AS1 TaxID=2907626 RepID=UPI001F22C5C4|nr:2Fe-2S iron-sulfur cluster-binding protein [Shewanella sp. AS1]MCE9679500.1 2Fe-2S iron-sulfur cluster-binding protein [Shewanella sp. AS1]